MSLPLPLRPLRCTREDCGLPQGGRCAREAEFSDPEAACPELLRAAETAPRPADRPSFRPAPPTVLPEIEEGEHAPWAGRHLPLDEARRLLSRSPARLLAILGAFDAGKTSLLASFFLQIANGQRPELPYRFAGSRSLHGFRDLVERARRYRGSKGEAVVDHSPTDESAAMGRLLHLAFRPDEHDDDRIVDVLLTDLPGEWMTEWAQVDDDTLDRRMPLLRRASGFVIVADAEALLAHGGAATDTVTGQFIRRATATAISDPHRRIGLSLVLTKTDKVLGTVQPPALADTNDRAAWGPLGKRLRHTWPALERARDGGLDVKLFPTSAFPGPLDERQPVNVVQPFAHVLRHADRRERWPIHVPEVPEGASCFQSLRRREMSP